MMPAPSRAVWLLALLCARLPVAAQPSWQSELPRVLVERDDQLVEQSCVLVFPQAGLEDKAGDGLVFVRGNGLVLRCEGRLDGNPAGLAPDSLSGIGLVLEGHGNEVQNLRISGFKIGLWARRADGLRLCNARFEGLLRQRLRSTPSHCDDDSDWLSPHDNDANEWAVNYGTALYLEDSSGLWIENVRVRDSQNGLLCDRVQDSTVVGCDASFLSGWGLGLWRSNGNDIVRNAFDFCVRGYSHGVYNRGQDSAGILMFEQCHANLFLENSVTHGGDGLFAFAGREALGERPAPTPDFDYTKAGHHDNVFRGNDFSYAAAHGLELTFSRRNWIVGNRFVENAICGIWGGYSSELCIEDNLFEGNGEGAYGAERGGINIEHGSHNRIDNNRFARNACGVRLWWDADEALASSPWAKANDLSSAHNSITRNRFAGDTLGIERERSGPDQLEGNLFDAVPTPQRETESSAASLERVGSGATLPEPDWRLLPNDPSLLERWPATVGARTSLRGREQILMTEWGPWDGAAPYLQLLERSAGTERWRVLGRAALKSFLAIGLEDSELPALEVRPVAGSLVPEFEVRLLRPESALPYLVSAVLGEQRVEARSVLTNCTWRVKCFATPFDPRERPEAFASAAAAAQAVERDALVLAFGGGGPSELLDAPLAWREAHLPADHFGTQAHSSLQLTAGRWALRVTSDDGVRVRLDGALLLEDWTWHAPKTEVLEFELEQPRAVDIEVEHFELDGFALLELALVSR